MLKRLPVILMTVAAAVGLHAAELNVRIELPKKEFVRGEPILVEGTVENVSGQALTLALGEPRGFRASFSMWRADGQTRGRCPDRDAIGPLGYVFEEVEPGWTKTYRKRVDCHDAPGEYLVRFVVFAEGPYLQPESDEPHTTTDAWSGRIESEPLAIRIVEPEGQDRLAFDTYHGDPLSEPSALLESFPDSTYTGYVILKGGPWSLDPVAELEIRGKYLETAERDPDALAQMERLEREQESMSRDRVRLLAAYLDNNPGFAYARFMRLELATRLAYLGRYGEARALCLDLQRDAPSSAEAARALELRDHLVREGLLEPLPRGNDRGRRRPDTRP